MDIYDNLIFKDIGNMINSHVQTLILEQIHNLYKIFKGYADIKNNNISEYCFLVLWRRNFYRPRTKFAKVVFTGVCLSIGGYLPSPPIRHHTGQIPPPDRSPGQTPPTGYYGIRSTSGRYASHWNVFLLHNCPVKITISGIVQVPENATVSQPTNWSYKMPESRPRGWKATQSVLWRIVQLKRGQAFH